jgi:hypothetical protein
MIIEKLRIRLPLNVFCNVSDEKIFAGMKYDVPAHCIDLHNTFVRVPSAVWPYDTDSISVPLNDADGAEMGRCVLIFSGASASITLDPCSLNSEQKKLFLERIDKGTDIFAVLTAVEIDETKEGEYPEIKKAALSCCFIDTPKLSKINEIISERNAAKKAKTAWIAELSSIAVTGKGEVSENE